MITNNLDLSRCKTPQQVCTVLDELSKTTNLSVSHALKAQIYVVKYISSPSLMGSTFDLFFKHLNDSIKFSDEDTAHDLRDQTGLMLNNFIFFMKAKIEWEIGVNRKELQNMLVAASKDLSESIINIASAAITGVDCGSITALVPSSDNVKQLSKVFTASTDGKDGWLSKSIRLVLKMKNTREKQQNFCKTLDLLAEKLKRNFEIIGENDLVAGIYENYSDDLIENHLSDLKNKAKWLKVKMQSIPAIVFAVCFSISLIVGLIMWITSFFSSSIEGYGMWTGIIVVGLPTLIALYFFIYRICILFKIKMERQNKEQYYKELITMFAKTLQAN